MFAAPDRVSASLCVDLTDPAALAQADAVVKAYVRTTYDQRKAEHLDRVYTIATARTCAGVTFLNYAFRPDLEDVWVGGEPIFMMDSPGVVSDHIWPD
ncbi:MAG: hypothetical protein AAFN59_01910 [Pseudomonadota bacterium]